MCDAPLCFEQFLFSTASMADDELVDYDEAEEPEVEAAKVSLRTGGLRT